MRLSMVVASLFLLLILLASPFSNAYGQGGDTFDWGTPLNAGDMPEGEPLLPPINVMPTLPLDTWGALASGTVFINVDGNSTGQYEVQTVTFDERRYAFNITTGAGVLPVSPSGQYGIYTVGSQNTDIITCAIRDLVGNFDVDRFESDAVCESAAWSPDSTRIAFTTLDEEGNSALAIRQDGQTTTFRPQPFGSVDLGGAQWDGNPRYLLNGWLSDGVLSYEMSFNNTILSQEMYVRTGALNAGYVATELTLEQSSKRLVAWKPAQPVGALYRDIQLMDIVQNQTRALAPEGYSALYADVSPDGNQVVYWAAPKIAQGWGNPLRLVIYDADADSHTVLLEFGGPEGEVFVTRPGKIFWYGTSIYFHISQQSDEFSDLETGTYRIEADGSVLEFISAELLIDGIYTVSQ